MLFELLLTFYHLNQPILTFHAQLLGPSSANTTENPSGSAVCEILRAALAATTMPRPF